MTTALAPQMSRARIREVLAFSTGFFYSGVNTGTSASAVTAAAIARWDTGRLTNLWVLITSGNRVGESRRTQSVLSTTATLVAALSGVLANGDTFEFLPYDPDIMHYGIQEACKTVWPKVVGRGSARGLVRDVTEYIVVDNLVDNPFFASSESTGAITAFATYDSTVEGATLVEDAGHGLSSGDIVTISGTTNYNGTWGLTAVSASEFWLQTPFIDDEDTGTWREGYSSQAGTASGWTATSGTWTFPTNTRAWLGRHVASAAGAATLTQDIFGKVSFADAVNKTLHIRGAVRSGTADIARLRISFDGGSTFAASTPYHLGGGDWERPSTHGIDVAIPSGATTMTIYCDVAAGATPNFGGVWAWIDPITDYPLPDSFAANYPGMVRSEEHTSE